MHRRIVLFVALLAAFALAAPAGASAQSPAELAPSVAEAQEATTACGPGGVGDQLVPDSGPWFNFTAACANHDACYAAQQGQLDMRQGVPRRHVRPLRHAAVVPARAVSQHGQRVLRRGAALRTFVLRLSHGAFAPHRLTPFTLHGSRAGCYGNWPDADTNSHAGRGSTHPASPS